MVSKHHQKEALIMSNKLVDDLENNKKTSKNGKSYVYNSNFVPLHYGNSFDIALDKGACKRFQTRQGTGEFSYFTSRHNLYKKNYKGHKKGDRKPIKYERTIGLYSCLAEAWKAVSDTPEYSLYIQASTGLTHKRRDVIVLDFDANKFCSPLPNGDAFGYRSFEDAEKDVTEFVKKSGLPKQSYIYYNKKSGNIQVGWFFSPKDSVFYDNVHHQEECRQYLNMGAGLNKLWTDFKGMPGDTHFTGWQCKNPYNKNTELREVKFYFDNYDDFENNFERILDVTEPFFPVSEKECKKIEKFLKTEKTNQIIDEAFVTYEPKESNNKLNKDSRNYYEVSCLRKWIWDYAREHNNSMPTFADAMDAMLAIEKKANEKIKGKKAKSIKELNATCKSVLNWSIRKYNKPGNNFFTDEQRYHAKLYNYAKMYSNIQRLKSLSNTESCRKAGKKLGLSKTTISRYRNLTEKQLKKIQILAKQFEIYNAENVNQLNKGIESYNNKYTQKVLELEFYSKKEKKSTETSQILPKKYYYKREGTQKTEKMGFKGDYVSNLIKKLLN